MTPRKSHSQYIEDWSGARLDLASIRSIEFRKDGRIRGKWNDGTPVALRVGPDGLFVVHKSQYAVNSRI